MKLDTALVVRVVDIGSEGNLDFATIQIFISSQKCFSTDPFIAPSMALTSVPSMSPSSSKRSYFQPCVNSNLLGRIKKTMIFATETLFVNCGVS